MKLAKWFVSKSSMNLNLNNREWCIIHKRHQANHKKLKHIKKRDVYGQEEIPDQENKTGDRHPTSILKFNGDVGLHRTQKPVELCKWLINTYSNEGDVVLDFTMGSGTTGVACLETNRRFIGIEKDEEIYKVAKNRLESK